MQSCSASPPIIYFSPDACMQLGESEGNVGGYTVGSRKMTLNISGNIYQCCGLLTGVQTPCSHHQVAVPKLANTVTIMSGVANSALTHVNILE